MVVRGIVIALVVVVAAAAAAPAQAQDLVPWQVGYTEQGLARFGVVHFPPELDVTVHRCPNGGACGKAMRFLPRGRRETTRWVDPRAIQAGDVLEIRYAHEGRAVNAFRSHAWRGRPLKRARPTITGRPVVGETVQLTDARWTGGWASGWPRGWRNGSSSLFLMCKTATGTGCESVALPPTLTLESRMAGRYLFAETDFFFWSGQVAGIVLGPTGDLEPMGRLGMRSRPFGPIQPRSAARRQTLSRVTTR